MNGRKPENQEEMEQITREYVGIHNRCHPGTMSSMTHPQFVECSFEEQTLTLAFAGEEWMRNPVGVMHGGITAAVIDITMGMLTYVLAGQVMPPTISLQISYLRPVPLGGRIIVRARADSVGRTKAALVAELWSEEQPKKRLATGTGIYYTAGGPMAEWKYEPTQETKGE